MKLCSTFLYFVMYIQGVDDYSFVFSLSKLGVLKQGPLTRLPWASQVIVKTRCFYNYSYIKKSKKTFAIHVYKYFLRKCLTTKNRISGGMVSVLTSSAVDRGFESRSAGTKHHEIDICYFSMHDAVLRSMSKYRLAWNQDNVSEWSNI